MRAGERLEEVREENRGEEKGSRRRLICWVFAGDEWCAAAVRDDGAACGRTCSGCRGGRGVRGCGLDPSWIGHQLVAGKIERGGGEGGGRPNVGSGQMRLVGSALKTKGVAAAWGLDGWDKVPRI